MAIIKTILLVPLLFILSCSQKNNIRSSYSPKHSKESLLKKLETYRQKNQPDSLALFFSEWNTSIPSNNQDTLNQNDTIKAVYNVYKNFYKPLDLLKLGDWEWENKLNAGAQYVVVKNSISCIVLDSDSLTYSNDEDKILHIRDFRPILDIDKSKVLYLTPEYEYALSKFLGNNSTKTGERNIMDPAAPKGESERRYNLIRPFIPVLHGHWGGYWHLDTHPSVYKIILNRTLTRALILYRVGYQGGEAFLEMDNGEWAILKSQATWIE